MEKAQQLATHHQVTLQTECADLTTWRWRESEYDFVIAIYLHFVPAVRQQMQRAMLSALKPGGLLILEAFNPAQLDYQRQYDSGGPKVLDMLYTPEMLRQDFAEGKMLELTETIANLTEGQYHHGLASVIRLVLQK